MLRRRRERVRRVAMWAAGVVLVMSVAAWVASLWGLVWETEFNRGASLYGGAFSVGRGNHHVGAGFYVLGFERPYWTWPPWPQISHLGIEVQIYPLVCASAAVLWGTWLSGRTSRSRALGHCRTCGYDLTGIEGVCPECGSGQAKAVAADSGISGLL